MATTINDFLKKNGEKIEVSYEKMSEHNFAALVDSDTWRHDIDYLPTADEMRVIKVCYPSEYYAMSQYLTTKRLTAIFEKSDKTLNGFLSEVLDEVRI